MKWTIYRVIIIALNVWAIVMYPRNQSNLDWMACLLGTTIMSAFLFVWLTVRKSRRPVDCSDPCSWITPFFPMNKHPVRFWILVSISWMLAGGIAILNDHRLHNGQEAFGGTFFFIGLGIGLTLMIWIKINEPTRQP
jgi:hypothetical protein